MNMTFAQIRQALIQIAERLGRPPYEHCVYVAVANAIKSGTEHHLKSLVLSEKIVIPLSPMVSSTDKRIDELRAFCAPRGMAMRLSKHAQVNQPVLSRIIREEIQLTDHTWAKLKKAFAPAQTELDREMRGLKPVTSGSKHESDKACAMCGTFVRYVGSNKCVECVSRRNEKYNNGQKIMSQVVAASVSEARSKKGVAA